MLRIEAPMKRLNKPPKVAINSFMVWNSVRTVGINVSSLNDTVNELNVTLEWNHSY